MMMKTIKSFILGAMALAMVAPVFTACGDDDTKTETVEKIIYSLKSEYSYNDSIVAAQKAKSKKDVAVLLVAFGSTWDNAFKAFDKTKAAYESAFPNADVYVCFSSDICIRSATTTSHAICCMPLVLPSTARFTYSRCRLFLVRSLPLLSLLSKSS